MAEGSARLRQLGLLDRSNLGGSERPVLRFPVRSLQQ